MAQPTRLGDVLRAALARLPDGAELSSFPIWSEWQEAVGPLIARHAEPRRLRGGVLVVVVDGPEWLHELRYLERELRERLNARLGRSVVHRLVILLGTEPHR